MRVTLTCDAVGGIWTHSLDLASGLCALGWEVSLVVFGPVPSEEQTTQARDVGLASLHHIPTRLEWMPEPWDHLEEAADRLEQIVDEERPNLLHLNSYHPAGRPWQVPVVLGAHSCVLSWWRAVKGVSAPPEWDRYALTVALGLSAADAVVAPSNSMLRQLRDAHPHAPCCGWSTMVIHNGRAGFEPAPGERRGVAMAVGRAWDEAKNLETVDRVASMLSVPVEVAGAGSEDLTHARGLGVVQPAELSVRLGESAVFLSPARYEPFGLAVLEAALSGCALVLSDIPTFRELWWGAALFASADDAEALATRVEDLLADPGSMRRLSSAARTRASTMTVESMARAYSELYTRLLEQARVPVPT